VTRARLIPTAAAVLVTSLVFAAPAMARGGEGTYGKYDDKVVTNFGFGLIIFFTVLVLVLSIAQALLERRKRSR
jgi:putative copper export protein